MAPNPPGHTNPTVTDEEGKFRHENPFADTLFDIWVDGSDYSSAFPYAPAFLFGITPSESPHRVIMPRGKLLKGRIVERVGDRIEPKGAKNIEFRLLLGDALYGNRQHTMLNGEFQFRICEPPEKWPWMLAYAGTNRKISIDYEKITPDTFVVIEVSVSMKASYEQTPGAHSSEDNADLTGSAQE